MIVSGHYIGILEPQEEVFEIEGRKSPGMIWHLEEDREEIKLLADQVGVTVILSLIISLKTYGLLCSSYLIDKREDFMQASL